MMSRRMLGCLAGLLSFIGMAAVPVEPAAGTARAAFVSAARLVSAQPYRVLDTRSGPQPQAGAQVVVQTGVTGDAVAVTLGVTMTRPAWHGYITVNDCTAGSEGPRSLSHGNFANDEIAATSTVQTNPDGSVCVFVSAPVHLVVDVLARFGPQGDLFTPLAARRALDTRGLRRPAAGSITRIDAQAPVGATAVQANIAVLNSRPSTGYVTADRCDVLRPGLQNTSNGNFNPGYPISVNSIVRLDRDGAFCIYASASVDLVVDIQGAYLPNGLTELMVLPGDRVLDTRVTGRLEPGRAHRVRAGLPSDTLAALTSIIAVGSAGGPTHVGFLAADNCDAEPPGPMSTSIVNFTPFHDIANAATVPLARDGSFCIWTSESLHVVVDVHGAYRPSGAR